MAFIISSCTLEGFVTTLHSVCACVLALVLGWMCHLVPAACKDVSSSIRWPLYKLMYFRRVVTTILYIVCVCLCIGPCAWMDVSSGL